MSLADNIGNCIFRVVLDNVHNTGVVSTQENNIFAFLLQPFHMGGKYNEF